MGFCGGREKIEEVSNEEKWDYINLSDFKSSSCFTPLSYGILYICLIVSIAVYAVDVFTAVNLLAFNHWSGQIQPAVPFTVTKWIFAGCIILSWILLVHRWLRAVRAMRTGGIAQSYLDPLAVRIQSVRMGARGRGWRRFLVFAELTKSKKGSEYVALFTYYNFEAWLRIVFAEGPRIVINAITLYSVMTADIIPTGKHAASSGHTPIVQFFVNVKILADANTQQAVILFGMLFTLIIWIISAISLLIACIFYITFLWHYIPGEDGGLAGYCKRKTERRLRNIVSVKVKNALAKENVKQTKGDSNFGKAGDGIQELKRQPTLPILDPLGDDKLPDMPIVSRQTTQTSLPPYSSEPPKHHDVFLPRPQRQPTIPDVSLDREQRNVPTRSTTQTSATSSASYSSNTPLIGSGQSMGQASPGRTYSPAPISRMASDSTMPYNRPSPMDRSATGSTQRSYRSGYGAAPGRERTPGPPSRQNTGMSDYESAGRSVRGPPMRQNTGTSDYQMFGRASPIPEMHPSTGYFDNQPSGRSTPGPPVRQNTGISAYQNNGRSTPNLPRSDSQNTTLPAQYPQRNPLFTPQPPQPSCAATRYIPYAPPTNIPPPPQPYRNFSTPNRLPPQNETFDPRSQPPPRAGTAPPPQHNTYDDSIYDSYGASDLPPLPRVRVPVRSATTDASGGGWDAQRQFGPGGF